MIVTRKLKREKKKCVGRVFLVKEGRSRGARARSEDWLSECLKEKRNEKKKEEAGPGKESGHEVVRC